MTVRQTANPNSHTHTQAVSWASLCVVTTTDQLAARTAVWYQLPSSDQLGTYNLVTMLHSASSLTASLLI